MYQSVYYDYSERKYYIRDDEQGWVDFQHQPILYRRTETPGPYSLPILTGGFADPVKKYGPNDVDLLERDISKELVILRDLYYKYDEQIPTFHNVVFLDIETKMGGALTPEYVKEAPMPITSIALIDKNTKMKYCLLVDETGEMVESTQDNKKILPFKTEYELIMRFLDLWEELDPTIVATWNGEFFDIPWIYFRFRQIVGDQVKRLSPIRKINIQERKDKETGQFKGSVITIGGVNHLDYMLLHKKYIMKEEPSYKLADIGPKYAKLDKLEYEGNLNQLFKTDINRFIDYNIRDVEILEGLESNLKFIELTVLISHICNTPYEQIYYNTVLGEGAILKFLKQKGIVSPNKPTTHNPSLRNITASYAGGYIKEPVPGLYFDTIDLDFTSLYPSIIKSLNLGIETLIARIVTPDNYTQNNSLEKLEERDPKEVVILQRLNKTDYTLKSTEVTIGQLVEIIKDSDYTISASGAIFDTSKKSVAAQILEGWFEKREYYRGVKKTAGKAEDWSNYKLYDNFQLAFKILQNALYGTFAKAGWRYTDGHLICSAAITNSGQRLTQESISFVNKTVGNGKDLVIISDTDSMYIQVGDILKALHPDLEEKDKDKVILKIAGEIQDTSNAYLNELSHAMFNVKPNTHYFQLKQEVIARSIIVTGKRRYAMYITNKEGVPIEEMDMKGIELMKSNMNKMFKKFGENMVKEILFGKPKQEIDKSIIAFYKSLKTTDPRFLGKPTGVKHIHSYTKRKARTGEIFSEFELGAPANTKAAVRYNDLLRFKRLDKKFEGIIEGDKIYIINLKKNNYQIDTVGLPTSKVPEEIEAFVKAYIDVDEIFESILLNKLKGFYQDLSWEFPSLNDKVTKFFKFN